MSGGRAAPSGSSAKERYPGMREFATRMFQEAPRSQHGELSRKLKNYLEVAKSKGIATTLNWAEEDLESLSKKLGIESVDIFRKDQETNNHSQKKKKQSTVSTPQVHSSNHNHVNASGREAPRGDVKPKNHAPLTYHQPTQSNDVIASYGNGGFANNLKRQNSGMPMANNIMQKRRQMISAPSQASRHLSNTNKSAATKQALRQERFSQSNTSITNTSPYVTSQIKGQIIGTNEQLEKPYFRLTGQVNPAVVRPPHILKKSLAHVLNKYRETRNYHYASDQLQSIRQDLTVQHVESELAVEAYELNTRIALENDDIGEFNKCLSRLLDLYAKHPEFGENRNEFKAYSIYYTLLLRKWDDLSFEVQRMDCTSLDFGQNRLEGPSLTPQTGMDYPTDEEGRNLMLQRALTCIHSVLRDSVISLWQSKNMIWPLENKLLGKIIERAQARALEGLLVSTYQQNQDIPLKHINLWLGLNSEHKADLTNIKELLDKWEIPYDGEKKTISAETAIPYVQKFVAKVDGKFDIKGQK